MSEVQYPLPEPAVVAALGTISFNADGLVAAIAQQHDTGEVLMMAWMNADSVAETLRTGRVCYWSRSRKALWRKGETSGQMQVLKQMLVDCDGDTVLLRVHQDGVACHTGRRTCFYNAVTGDGIAENEPVRVDPAALYGSRH